MKMQSFVILLFLAFVDFSLSDQWNYLEEDHWPGLCKDGNQQSPINILTNYAVVDMKHEHIMGPLVYRGYSAVDVAPVNNGHTLQWDAVQGTSMPVLAGGPLAGNYTFLQLHMHWLSEHAINGLKYPLEIHFVHIKTGIEPEEALKRPDGVAVIGVLANVQYGSESEYAFEELIDVVPQLVHPTPSEPGAADIVDLTRLFSPDPQSYFTYQGSLTTPECQEVVTWIVMDQPITISDTQYKTLTKVDIGGVNNFRSLQSWSNRVVYHSTTSCATMLGPSLALLGALLQCTLTNINRFIKRGACLALNFKRRILGWKPLEC